MDIRRGGRNSKPHSLTDGESYLLRFPLTGGNITDYGDAVERIFYRPKYVRRIATRYDKLAVNFLRAICVAAAVTRCG